MKTILQSLKSRTIWFGILEVTAGVSLALQAELQTGATLTAIGVITIVLRVVTKTALRDK